MRHPISDADRRKVETALRQIGEVIKAEYPEPTRAAIVGDNVNEVGAAAFRWGLGDGFAMALRGVVDAALPGWNSR